VLIHVAKHDHHVGERDGVFPRYKPLPLVEPTPATEGSEDLLRLRDQPAFHAALQTQRDHRDDVRKAVGKISRERMLAFV